MSARGESAAEAVRVAVAAAAKVSQRGPMSVGAREIAAMARVIETLLRDAFDEEFLRRSRGATHLAAALEAETPKTGTPETGTPEAGTMDAAR